VLSMDLDQLQAFERIVREGSFSRAARSLAIAQPTISARIQALEADVGGPLFLRGGRKIALTEGGERFLPYAQHAIAVLAEGVETARLTQSGQRGRVTIAALPSLAGSFLAAAIARFHQTHPQAQPLIKVPLDTARHLLLRGIGAALLTPLLVAEELAAGRIAALTISDAPPDFRENVLVRLARGSALSAAAEEPSPRRCKRRRAAPMALPE